MGSMGKRGMNDFQIDLEYSLKERDNVLFDNLYYRVFPHLQKIKFVTDLKLQKQGIDKELIFGNGKHIFIDEKKRRKDYGDILLEEYSNWECKVIGWLGKSKKTDYIVYAIMPTKTVYFLPFLLLQKAWLHNYKNWLRKYGRIFADNPGYKTSNIAVPTLEVLDSIRAEMQDTF